MLKLDINTKSMFGETNGVFTFYLSDLERSMLRSLRFGRPISQFKIF